MNGSPLGEMMVDWRKIALHIWCTTLESEGVDWIRWDEFDDEELAAMAELCKEHDLYNAEAYKRFFG